MGHTCVWLVLVLSCLWWSRQTRAQVSHTTLSVPEGVPAKTIVGDIGAALRAPRSSTGFFISESRDSYVFKDFDINAETGVIATAVVLDRESRDKYEFVAATLTGEVIKVKIEVTDVNDNSPAFTSDTIDLEISELSPPGSRFELEGAKDRDEGHFGTQGYRIAEVEMRELFQVEYHNGSADNPFDLHLLLASRLDREARDSFSLTVEAFDGGVPARTGSLRINVHVLDENDHSPVFDQTEYHARCPRTLRDADDLLGVTVTLEGGQGKFALKQTDHFLYALCVDGPLDREETARFELRLRASDQASPLPQHRERGKRRSRLLVVAEDGGGDGGEQALSSTATVTVVIEDVNDNEPVFQLQL
ncbi:hypothetical protein CRUP_022303 [Coryphaenoides rupestris]|nr:hypothetical protein CRUP_022303 [Coryphaenoides rupestris]